jgi:hypothetical protein
VYWALEGIKVEGNKCIEPLKELRWKELSVLSPWRKKEIRSVMSPSRKKEIRSIYLHVSPSREDLGSKFINSANQSSHKEIERR